jgi:hypothetical protein
MRWSHPFSAITAVALLFTCHVASGKGMLSGDFDVYSVDDQGGGWVINRIPVRGDLLWGCKDVATVQECDPVPLPDFYPATVLNFLHISDDSQAAWLRVSVPVLGDYLMACFDPEGKPHCDIVDLELRPPTATLAREWPDYEDVGAAAAAGGGGPLAALSGGDAPLPPAAIIEPPMKGDMWLSAALKIPGPLNLYACRNLEGRPECKLAIPDYYLVDREDVGFKKFSEVPTSASSSGVGILVDELVEGSAAEEADIRAGDVIVKVCGFEIKSDKHFKGLIAQIPATYSIPVHFENGDKVKIKVRRKPKDDKK